MLFKNYIITILYLLNRNFINGQQNDESHSVYKRMDLESCLAQFDIHGNMIIRTEESLAIGGKYLQGMPLETVEECRRLCCETEFCDVFVFEEKAEEYCYLFECGRPENFRCKFTKHGNFTSAVLTPITYMTPPTTTTTTTTTQSPPLPPPPPPPQIIVSKLNISMPPSKQEMELKNLKQKLDIQTKKNADRLAPVPSTVTLSTTVKTSTIPTQTTCGRFQFQCHSGECIGIYNACNGIPQCQDGSDEGPECSDPANNNMNNNIKPNSYIRMLSNNPIDINDPTLNKSPTQSNGIQQLPSESYQQQRQSQQQQIIQGSQILNRDDTISGPNIMWPSRKIPSEQQINMKTNSEIFRHKAGLQIPSNNIASFPNQNPNSPSIIYNGIPNQRGIYVPQEIQNAYRNGIIQPQDHIILPNMNWPQQEPLQPLPVPENPYNSVNLNIQQQQLQQQQPKLQSPTLVKITQETIDPSVSVQITPGNIPSPPASDNNSNIQDGNINSIKSQNDDKSIKNKEETKKNSEEYADYTENSTEPPKKKHKHKKGEKDSEKQLNKSEKEHSDIHQIAEVKVPYHAGYKMEMEFVDHDGYSERPGGAVLSLTLGVLVTAALAVLIGCRLRTVGRRVRRLGKAPYGTEADYLVNGMYL
ncbi:putative uncharacterized protein DDB_G0282129 [Condylostylus longicornis]|uniref:putative uncharacterized protein DDB_G0282129 n=1 Tax=Condylostylus longicornis TaxID=2530218 RepID=UPI00244DD113|nr:putative uncharacterized protein DDB_G0282129 [Condylostylus longicornis]